MSTTYPTEEKPRRNLLRSSGTRYFRRRFSNITFTQQEESDFSYHILKANCKDKSYTDLIEKNPYRSSRANKYIFICYHYDANVILATPIRNRKSETITTAWRDQNARFKEARAEPNTYVMDNEASKDLKDILRNADTKYQLVPPYNHKTNLSERVIQTFKGHFKVGLELLDPDLSISEWDRILEQGELTLNLL